MTDVTSAPRTDVPEPERRRGWTAGRVVLVVIGSILGLIGLALLAAGVAGTIAAATQRDSAGYFTTDTERFSSGAYAITSDKIDLGANDRPRDGGFDLGDLLRVRLRAAPADETRPIFIGIARTDDVNAYLGPVAHDVVDDVRLHPFRVRYRTVDGTVAPASPDQQPFWVVSNSGTGRQTVIWEPGNGDWTVVLMNADASQGVAADVDVGVQVKHLWVIVGVLLGLGVVLLASGVTLIIATSRRVHAGRAPSEPGAPPPGVAVSNLPPPGPPPSGLAPPDVPPAEVPAEGEEAAPPGTAVASVGGAVAAAPVTGAPARPLDDPIVLVGRIDHPLSRWLWLVKWLLAIPHYVVLVILWIVAIILTIVAGFAILFTGRYPRGLFEFNVGVLRWTWRVSYYATGVLGTDRYPPFTLDRVPDHPAQLDLEYPEHLSRGLVLVKWWLLAIPHYIIVGIIGTGWWWGMLRFNSDAWTPGRGGAWGGGLLGVLVVIAAVRLLFTGHYPREMFDFVMGLNRWVFRVAAYALLMTDRYPPFRLDQGGDPYGFLPEAEGLRGGDPGSSQDPGARSL